MSTLSASCAAGLWKFRAIPSYHTRAAKTCWLLVGIAAVCLFAGGPIWTLRVALAAIVLTNIEGILITRVLPRAQSNVTSLYHVMRRPRAG